MKDIKGYEGIYAITSCGKVWSYKRQKLLSQWSNGTPYLLVTLCKEGKKKNYRVHRLVAEAYVPNPDPMHLTKVDHNNNNTHDNYANNLRWSDNVINCCNRKNNIPITDSMTCEMYCSLSRAVKATGIKRSQIIKDCNNYRETNQVNRFIYSNDLTPKMMAGFISDSLTKNKKNVASA